MKRWTKTHQVSTKKAGAATLKADKTGLQKELTDEESDLKIKIKILCPRLRSLDVQPKEVVKR